MLLEIIAKPTPLLISLLIIYFLLASIVTWDIRLGQAVQKGGPVPDHPRFGVFICFLFWVEWGIWFWILFLDWRIALTAFILKFILAALPVLQFVGSLIMSPFLRMQMK